MKPEEFEFYQTLLLKESGLSLSIDQTYLLEARLRPVAKMWEHENLDALTKQIMALPDKKIIDSVVEAMTTNETSFFRDKRPFDLFEKTVLPYFLQKRAMQKKLKIWSAACSSGQEAYSLSFILNNTPQINVSWKWDIIGTDISKEIVETAKTAEYSHFEVQRGLPIQMLAKYFTQNEKKWSVNELARKNIQFQYLNLLNNFGHLGQFDIIFCRNVLIYFDDETKRDVLNRLRKQLAPDGFLFLGGAETIINLSTDLKTFKDYRGLYGHTNHTYDIENHGDIQHSKAV